jgi:methylated-DNA-protein-cysteine methyltransferase-like protein
MTISREEAAGLCSRVYALVRACPAGRVTTYGWLAAALGYPRGARMVGWIMNVTPRSLDVPAHRVISKDGALTGGWAFGSRERMQSLLEAEGIGFTPQGRVDMARFGWDPVRDLNEQERQAILDGAASLTVVPPAGLLRQLSEDPASPFKAIS